MEQEAGSHFIGADCIVRMPIYRAKGAKNAADISC